ncbi:hypothetical protein OQA88_582 [Cercophora sp. LCS_1]
MPALSQRQPLQLPALEAHVSADPAKPTETASQEDQQPAQLEERSSESSKSAPSDTKELSEPPPEDEPGKKAKGTSGPIDTLLHMEPPAPGSPTITFNTDSTKDPSPHPPNAAAEAEAEANTKANNGSGTNRLAPHLHPPPYVHHFDSYSLVKQLETGGYSLNQSITAMKAVRGLLATNLDVAQSELVSKSDVENETYLFRAACSELSTEVKNNRRVADEHLRQQRTLLQHEVDILQQHLNQELLTLNDHVRGMFNDRRMAVREEQKAVDSRVWLLSLCLICPSARIRSANGGSQIQQINYKISVMLNSDAKSEIEALRWVLIRRSVLGIVFMAVLTLGTLRYATHVNQERKKEAERLAREREREAEESKKPNGKIDATSAPEAAEILAAA